MYDLPNNAKFTNLSKEPRAQVTANASLSVSKGRTALSFSVERRLTVPASVGEWFLAKPASRKVTFTNDRAIAAQLIHSYAIYSTDS